MMPTDSFMGQFPNAVNAQQKDNSKVLRLSDVYLIAAEASVTSDPNASRGFLNALVAQRDPLLNYTDGGTQLTRTLSRKDGRELAFGAGIASLTSTG